MLLVEESKTELFGGQVYTLDTKGFSYRNEKEEDDPFPIVKSLFYFLSQMRQLGVDEFTLKTSQVFTESPLLKIFDENKGSQDFSGWQRTGNHFSYASK